MGYCVSGGVGEYVAGERHSIVYPKNYKADGTKRAVIWCHAHGESALSYQGSALQLYQLARRGILCIATDLGGTATFGNDTTLTRIGQAWTYAKNSWGAKTDKLLLLGQSMGGLAALNYMRSNPTNVAAMVGFVPGNDLADLHDNDRGGLATSIRTAWGAADSPAMQATYSTSNPSHASNLATHNSQAIPMKWYYATDDGFIPPGTVTAFDAAVTALELVSLGAVGHNSSSVDGDDVADFFTSYLM